MDSHVSIGETLRRRREERGLTAEQAAFQSKVPLRLVQALESDDYQLLPDPLYLIGLLHTYSTFLGLDVAALDAEFQQAIQRPPRPTAPPAAPRATTTLPWKQVLWTGVAILVVTPLLVIALSLASKRATERVSQPRAGEQKSESAASLGGGEAGSKEPVSDMATPPTSPLSVALPDTAPLISKDAIASSAHAGHVLVARAQETTWMSVRADNKDPREVLLQAGQMARFEAQTGFRVVVGNAGGVTLSLDGTPLPPLGRSGEVIRNLVLPLVGRDSPSSGTALAVPAR
jgi:cytoskeletal protein RodZ